jgi:hypothetical protein
MGNTYNTKSTGHRAYTQAEIERARIIVEDEIRKLQRDAALRTRKEQEEAAFALTIRPSYRLADALNLIPRELEASLELMLGLPVELACRGLNRDTQARIGQALELLNA